MSFRGRSTIFIISLLILSVARFANAAPAEYELEMYISPVAPHSLLIWITSSIDLTQRTYETVIPPGPLNGVTLTATSPLAHDVSEVLVHCQDEECANSDLELLSQSRELLASFAHRTENRLAEIHTSLEPEKTWFKPVRYSSTTSKTGYSAFRLQERNEKTKQLQFDVEGPLQNVQGNCQRLNQYQPWKDFANVCLAGVADDQSLLLRLQPNVVIINPLIPFDLPMPQLNAAKHSGVEVSIWIKVMPPGFVIPPLPNAYGDPEASTISQEIFSEIEAAALTPQVRLRIDKTWKIKWRGRLENFLTLLKAPKVKTTRACEAQVMTGILSSQGFPEVVSIITLIESDFTPLVLSPKDALGFWQFIPQTALDYGLKLKPVDERTLIRPSTEAASAYLQNSLAHYPGPNTYKFALASYNSGLKNVDAQLGELQAKQKVPLAPQDVFTASSNFWDLYKYHLLFTETQDYVLDVLAASYLALHPEEAGLAPDLALDKPVRVKKMNLSCR